jgi:hypothetical protein
MLRCGGRVKGEGDSEPVWNDSCWPQAMTRRRHLPSLPMLLLSACAAAVEVERPQHALEVELRQFQQAQDMFRQQNTAPLQFEFQGHGRVTVKEITLDGFPSNSYLRCRFHYQNRTDKPVVQAFVSLDLVDAQDRVRSSQTCHCIVPYPVPIERGAYYADELRTPTYGVHLEPGWGWRIRCTAELQQPEEPLSPPVPERTIRQVPPMWIKDRTIWVDPPSGIYPPAGQNPGINVPGGR